MRMHRTCTRHAQLRLIASRRRLSGALARWRLANMRRLRDAARAPDPGPQNKDSNEAPPQVALPSSCALVSGAAHSHQVNCAYHVFTNTVLTIAFHLNPYIIYVIVLFRGKQRLCDSDRNFTMYKP